MKNKLRKFSKRNKMETRVKDIIEVLEFGFAMQKAIVDSASDGKWSLLDYTNFLSVIPKVGPAVENIAVVPKIIATATDVEKSEIMDYVRAKFELPDSDLEVLIEETLEQVLSIVSLGNRGSQFQKKVV